jgi:hypothetical protein
MEVAGRFKNTRTYEDFCAFLRAWEGTTSPVRDFLLQLKSIVLELNGTELDFLARPGVSYSLRAEVTARERARFLVLMDVVDDDPENRWLSVCFYADAVSDPEGLGNLVPQGILGEDGYCFDVFEEDGKVFLGYLEERIREAYEMLSDKPDKGNEGRRNKQLNETNLDHRCREIWAKSSSVAGTWSE